MTLQATSAVVSAEFVAQRRSRQSVTPDRDDDRRQRGAIDATILRPTGPHGHFGMACVHCAIGTERALESALESLETAVRYGWSDRGRLRRDERFAALRADPRFAALVGE